MISKLDEEDNTRNESGKSVTDSLRHSIGIVTILCWTDQHEPKLVASVSDFRGGGGYIRHFERRDWISNEWGRISGGVALNPHEERKNNPHLQLVKIEFGWSSDRKVVGFRISGGYYELPDIDGDSDY